MKSLLLAAAVLALVPAFQASAEPGRTDALKKIAGAFAEPNPGADPTYLQDVVTNLPEQLAKCRYQPEETRSIEQLVSLFDQYISLDKQDKAGLLAAIKRDFPTMKGSDYLGLRMGIMAAPDVTKASLVNASCPLLLKMHYQNGASRAELLDAIEKTRPTLEDALAR